MPSVRVALPAESKALVSWADLRDELGIVEKFASPVLAEAEAASAEPRLPTVDRSDLPFLTLDPEGSCDLDQALHIERRLQGFTVHYAIADVAAFVVPGGNLDRAARKRGETLYCPDIRVPLYPPLLSEGAASLLPGQLRPALLWSMELDRSGELISTSVERALVRSQRQLDYETVQKAVDDGSADDQLLMLRDVGMLRMQRATERGAVDLPTSEQIVSFSEDLTTIRYRKPLDSEEWNSQISLLTGMAAARLMLEEGVGILRTLPPPDASAVQSLRLSAAALGVDWPEDLHYGNRISKLDPSIPEEAALVNLAARLLRGAGYLAFDGSAPDGAAHHGIGAPYAHCTAPLRRLVDRFVGEICVSLCAGEAVPGWVRSYLPFLPAEMAASNRRAGALERAVIALAEAVVLEHRVGEVFEGVVVDADPKGATVQLHEPAVRARCQCPGALAGQSVRVRLMESNPVLRKVVFEVA